MSACDNTQSNQIEVLIAKQAVCGAPDAAPVFKAPNRTDGIFKKTNSFFTSAEVKKSRQARKQILDNKDFAAEFPFELTSDIARYLEEALYSEFTEFKEFIALNLEFTAETSFIFDNLSTGALSQFEAGQFIFISNAVTPTFNGQYYIEAVIGTDTLQVKSGNITVTNGSVVADISGSMLRSGSTRKYLTVQNRYPRATAPLDGADFETLVNAVVNSVSLALGTSGAVTGTLSLIGGTEVDGLSKLDSQTDLASDDECPVAASGIISDIWIDFNQTDAGMSDATIDFGNNVTATPRAGKRGSHTMSEGDITCTGSLNSIPTKTNILAEKTKSDNVVQFSLTLPFELEGDRKLFFTLRNCIYTDVTMNVSGNELMLNSGTYAAQEDVYGCTLQVDANWNTNA
jgi:hypothetical protein